MTFHLAVPDGDLLFKLALPFAFAVPADTPIKDLQARSGAGDGSVRIMVAAEAGELERNPQFREWSAAAQPGGFAESISIDFGEEHDAFDRVATGDLDVMLAPGSQGSRRRPRRVSRSGLRGERSANAVRGVRRDQASVRRRERQTGTEPPRPTER